MDTSNHLCADKTIKGQSCENIIEEKNDPSTTNLDITNKNLIVNDSHSNNSSIITKAKKANKFKNIKSIDRWVVKDIFSFLSEKLKLEIIKYNKDLQKNLDINIGNYKNIRGIHREIDRNGKGKEYYISNNHIIFEGEYKNGKRWNGKEYNKYGELIYDGQYLNGIWNGKGKEYNNYGFWIFEGEFLNGERWNGKGVECTYDNFLEFEGEYLNGLRNGKGKEYYFYQGDLKFEGEYLNGERNGKGKEYNEYDGELIFEGEYKNGERWNGEGIEYKEYNGELIFEGEYLNGERWNGEGKEYDVNGRLIFEGEYLNGKKINKI